MRVLITGGSGFIGTNLVEFYLRKGCAVLNLDIRKPRNEAHSDFWRKVDILQDGAVADSVADFRPDLVLHMAARTDLAGSNVGEYRPNTDGVSNVIRAMHRHAPSAKVVFASSRLVCKIGYQPKNALDFCPSTAYGASKVEGERLVRERARDLDWTIVRPTSIWGPWFDEPYANFFRSVLSGRYLHPRGEVVLKSFGYIGNTVPQVDSIALSAMSRGRVLYLADYSAIEVLCFANLIRRRAGLSPVRVVPLRLLQGAAIVGDLLSSISIKFPLTTFRLANLRTEMLYDLSETREVVDELPYSIDEGVSTTIAWMRDHE